ncbi:Lipopolysaccharide-induced tumor necrosis factor-alpha factor [Schistosoma japonicum]|uniref:Lipopolysaccharide-induced tumor necrosis factor-alpha factor n=1 Tax=Schistosoma japonicum TaxID=6182 RepID=A0A4Z2DCP0_SCHJA|nr:Lipopolysaccharide-induced tumor necrosis factor-alpha factor like [Schistosoma japonicum]TNN14224.1 Lipopolysaccharide-induced tumor necrosis factor-alpha factor [Schistosoma japonicum]
MSLQQEPMLVNKNDQTKQTPVITGQPVPTIPLQNHAINMKCPNCQHEIITNIKYRNGTLTYAACAGLCLLGCFCGCCLIPFCVKLFKDVDHNCPECNHHVGTYRTLQEKYMK